MTGCPDLVRRGHAVEMSRSGLTWHQVAELVHHYLSILVAGQ